MKSIETEIMERSAIAKDLWEAEKQRRSDPKNAHDVAVEQQLYDELNKFGFDFYWSWQFQSTTFTKNDKAVIPIIIKYFDKFENKRRALTYLQCLGVKGFYEATEYLIGVYKKFMPPHYDHDKLNIVSQTIMRIRDPRYIDTYLSFLNDDVIVYESVYMVMLLGYLRAKKAIPRLIELLDHVSKIPEGFYGSVLEDCKYHISQEAIMALSKFKNPEHIKYVEKFLEPEKLPWINFVESKEQKYNYRRTYKQYKKITERAIRKLSTGK